MVDGAPVGVARSVAFNSGQTLGVFIEKGLKTAMGENERPHCRDWTRVGLIVVGEEKAPPGVPPALRAAVESSRGEARAGVEAGVDGAGADGAGGVGAGLDGPQAAGEQWKVHAEFNWTYAGTWRQQLESEKQATQWEKWVELNTRNLLAMKEQLERAQSLGLPNVEVNRVQVEAILEAIAQMIRAIRGKLGENEKKIEIEIRALGTPLMRAVELLLTWAEVDPDSDDWVFDTVLFNQLEEGAWLCRGCGSANFGDPLDEEPERARLCECARAAQVPKGRGASEPRLETKADSEGSFPVVEWNTANTGGHSLVIARKTLASLHCIRWDPDNLSRQRGERVAFRWPGPEEEAEGPVTALQVAALVWSVLFNAGAAKYVEWKMTKKSKKERST